MKSILKTVFVIIGTIIGAGFASGQEIWLFFNRYGNLGIVGMIIACSLSAILIYSVFRIIQKENITTYTEFLKKISHGKILNQVITIIIQAFLLISFYIMIAGMSAYFNQEFGVPVWICSILMSLLCYLTLQRSMKGIVIVNSFLIPCLILFVLYLGFKNIDFSIEYFTTQQFQINYSWNWILSSILYASYNSIMLIPILVELKSYIDTKNKARRVSILCAIILAILGICIFCLLLRGKAYTHVLELPMIEIVKEFGGVYPHLYGTVIVAAIFTSAISAGYGFLQNEVAKRNFTKGEVQKRSQKYYKKLLFIICISAPIIANFGFSNLVNKLYPLFGMLGLLQVIGILVISYYPIEKKSKN